MSDDLVSGLLGGVMGLGNATNEIGKDTIADLRQRLRDESLAALQAKRDERLHGMNKETQQIDIKSREKISDDRNTTLEKISNREHDMKLLLLAEKKDSNKAAVLKAQVSALAEARKATENGAGIDEVNLILTTAGLPELEEVVTDPGSGGFMGFGKREPTTVRKVKGSSGSGLGNDLDTLLVEGKSGNRGSWGTGVAHAADIPFMGKKTDGIKGAEMGHMAAAGVHDEKPKPKGLIGDAMAVSPEWNKPKLDPDPKTWKVQQQNGKYYVFTDEGPVEMTQQQIDEWKAATKKDA